MRTHATASLSRRLGTVLALAALTAIGACSSGSSTTASTTTTTTSTSPTATNTSGPTMGSMMHASGQHLDASMFADALKKRGTIVLDVRTPAEFASGHLPKARNINLEGSDFATQIANLDKNATYAVYCHSGMRSAQAMTQMAAAGFTHVFDLSGGLGAWQHMGGAMVMGAS